MHAQAPEINTFNVYTYACHAYADHDADDDDDGLNSKTH